MDILDPEDKNRLLAIEGFRKFVEDEEQNYVKKLKTWKKDLQPGSELADPRMLAASLTGWLRMFDERLRNLMWSIWRDNEVQINKFYGYIGKYFVDREAQT